MKNRKLLTRKTDLVLYFLETLGTFVNRFDIERSHSRSCTNAKKALFKHKIAIFLYLH